MQNHKVIPDKLNPNVLLHEFEIQGVKWHAIDTYVPHFEEWYSDFERVIAFESALGYRLRYNFECDEGYYIPAIAVSDADIIRLLKDNMTALKKSKTPLVIGFYYDALTPNECSTKNTNRIMEFCHESGIHIMISTGYTPSTATRKIATDMGGRCKIEMRVAGPMGVANNTMKQLCYITRRLDYYGGGIWYMIRLGPIVKMPNGKPSIVPSSFWREANRRSDAQEKKQIKVDHYMGLRAYVPSVSVVPPDYLSLIQHPNFAKEVAPPIEDGQIISIVFDSWREQRAIDIYGVEMSENPEYSSPFTFEGHGYQAPMPTGGISGRFIDNEFDAIEEEDIPEAVDYYPVIDTNYGEQ